MLTLIWRNFFWNVFQTWSIAKIDSTKYFKIDQSAILILLFKTAAIIYIYIYIYIFFKKSVRHISVKLIICIVLSFSFLFFFEALEKYSGKILMLKSFNRKLNSEKFGYFSWIAKIKSATFNGKSLITKVASAKTSLFGVMNRKKQFVKNFCA